MELFEILDKRFAPYAIPIVLMEKLYTGLRWAEGPVYFADQHCLLFSDVPNNRILRFDEQSMQVTVFRADSNFSNGNTRDRQGRLVTCEHRTRRVTRTEYDGTITILADSYEGKRLNSPNDVVVKSDGTVWFTDPSYGISAAYEGGKAESEIGSCNVYCFDPRDGSLRIVADDFRRPNGLAFSPDETLLYIADSGFWPTPIGRTTSVPSRSRTAGCATAAWSPTCRLEFRTASVSTLTATSGQAQATGSTVSRRVAISSARSPFQKRSPTSASAAGRATAYTSAGIRRSTAFT